MNISEKSSAHKRDRAPGLKGFSAAQLLWHRSHGKRGDPHSQKAVMKL